jgi:hypothetical protein
MKKILVLFLIFYSYASYSQLYEGQKFCEESKGYSFFPLEIAKKKILWYTTFYCETKNETKVINGKTYIEFKQDWENSESSILYLREEKGIVYEYESCCENETVRYDPSFTVGHNWKSVDGKSEYKIIAYDGKLKTPYCDYENLLVIDAKMLYGSFTFYYLKGHGYIGATKDNKLVSCVTPLW